MNQSLQNILNLVDQNETLSAEQKKSIIDSIKEADKAFAIAEFKLDRTEKVKRTTAILLEETITELELKRKAVEEQNHELEVESALERVRSVAMGMKKREDMLDICKIIAQQLSLLNVKEVRNIQTAIFYEDRGTYMNYQYYAKHDRTFITDTIYTDHDVARDFVAQMLKGKGEFYITHIEGRKKLDDWIEYQKSTNVFIDDYLYTATSLSYYWYSLGPVALGISTYVPLTEKEEILFKRFLNVFELAYRRYLDIEKAEAQAREAQIEAALERVRSRTMGMQKSEELKEVIKIVYEQFVHLNINVEHTGFIIDYKTSDDLHIWLADQHLAPSNVTIPCFDSPPNNSIKEAKEKGRDFFTYHLTFKEKNKFYQDLFKFVPGLTEETLEYYFNCAGLAGSGVLLETIGLYIENFSGTPYTDEENKILMRFGKVFQQTYTRFLDLQKAEAQAREAQIEASLEKVRSCSLAVNNINEFNTVVKVVFEKLSEFQIPVSSVTIATYREGSKDMVVFGCGEGEAGLATLKFDLPYFSNPFIDDLLQVRTKSATGYFSKEYSEKEKNEYYDHVFEHTELRNLPEDVKEQVRKSKSYGLSTAYAKNSAIMVNDFTGNILEEDQAEILKRFSNVFEQAYIRFLDLQKAEAQAREAQIETSLERVRSRTMAMHNSSELLPAAELLFDQVQQLGATLQGVAFAICDVDSPIVQKWTSIGVFSHPYSIEPVEERMYEAWKNQGGMYEEVIEGERQKKYYEAFMQIPSFREGIQKFIDSGYPLPTWQKNYAVPFKYGYLLFITLKPFDETQIFLRFGKVFEQTYTRFLDLQKAEAQARESQIQLALERVRARTMAMQKSDELSETAYILYQQFRELGQDPEQLTIGIINEPNRTVELWLTLHGKYMGQMIPVSIDEPFVISKVYSAFKQQEKSLVIDLSGKDLKDYNDYRNNLRSGLKVNNDRTEKRRVMNFAFFSKGQLSVSSPEPLSAEGTQLLERFAKVFEQTYTRFLDLQKAEAQARESQIEAALEKVRSRTMAMHKSDELSEAAAVLFQQLKELGEEPERIFIATFDEENPELVDLWGTNQGGKQLDKLFKVSSNEPTVISKIAQALKEKKKSLVVDLSGKELNDYLQFLKNAGIPVTEGVMNERRVQTVACFSRGVIGITTPEPHPQKSIQLLERFAGVFDLTYTRFLDLQRAEEQAREATIEAALEKVRGKAMAMHNSNDLSVTASMVFTELRKLGIKPIRCGVGLLNKESRKGQLYAAISSAEGDSLSLVGWVMLSGHPVLEKIYDTWLNSEEYYPELIGEQLKFYYELLLSGLPVPVPQDTGQKQYGTFLSISVGCLYAWSEAPYNEAEIKILKRFATIIDLTFRRYIELQKSEANAREAVKQAALDRIRADIASMRTIADLDRITPLIWNELTILGIPFIRCGVFIMDGSQELIHTFLSTPDGKAIAAFHLPYDTPGNIGKVLSHWKDKQNYIDHWDETTFTEFANTLVKQGALVSSEQYLKTIPQGGFYLHFLPFLQGMLYVGNTTQLSEDEINLIQSVADAFSTAYARYEDFNNLEAAKKQVDSTLNELQVTQKQLIQSEKMASLGELTAGIAHEIQNPLNFVNNFSEVSNELIDEMNAEIENGDMEEAKAIANDIKQNLEKINHHGKRADAIVKGMLQHSRSSSGQKEPTDINALVDEYLRLAYHGLRAKDKFFNATMNTDYDETLGKTDIIPQDMGRVILNLITNAFYAVTEKKKQGIEGYEPTISVSTKKEGNKVLISVKDNGNGIPQKVLDKIFQPFFTTKPTGQGTGLGLSLSYDIVKAHGGEIKVNTKENEGTEFIIRLPVV